MRRMLKALLCSLLVGALAVAAVAQSSTATIHGKVTNDSGAALANAKIEAVGTTSGFVTAISSGADGSFQLGGLTPGEYKLTASAAGLEPRQPVPAERRAGVPRHYPELQRAIRKGVERHHHCRHQVGRQRLPRSGLLVLPAETVGVGAAEKLQVLDSHHQHGLPPQSA